MWDWILAGIASWAITAALIAGAAPMLKKEHRRLAIIGMLGAAAFFFVAPIVAYIIWYTPKTTEVAQTKSAPLVDPQQSHPTNQQNNQNSSGTNFQSPIFNGPVTFNQLSPPIAPAPAVPQTYVAPPKPRAKHPPMIEKSPERLPQVSAAPQIPPTALSEKLRVLGEYCSNRPPAVVVNGSTKYFTIVGSQFDGICGCIQFDNSSHEWTTLNHVECRDRLTEILEMP